MGWEAPAVSNPNGGTDKKTFNDTVRMSQFVCKGTLAGTYTVGGTNPDYASLGEAMESMVTCGISAPVVLKLRSGNYAAQQIKGSIKGASTTNTVTVMPDSGASVIIDGGTTSASLTITNTAHWIFKNLTIGNTTNGLIGVLMQEDLEDITFRDCKIYSSKTTTSNNSYAVGYPNASNSGKIPVNVRFIHNDICGGYYNFYLYYMASSSSLMTSASLQIDSNTLSEAYYASIYTYFYSSISSLSYNTITNRANATDFFGVYAMYYTAWDKIEANRIHIAGSGSVYGFYICCYSQNSSVRKAYMTNNEIIVNNIQSTKNANKYGIYLYDPYGIWEVHHNSICVNSDGATNYGMYLYSSSTSYKINASRNLVNCDGKSTNYPLYISSAANASNAYGIREYNNLYSSTYVAYVGGAKTSIGDLQKASAQVDFSANGNYYFEACMQSQDDNSANDTARDSSIVIRQDIAISTIQGIDDQTIKMVGDTVFISAVIVNKGAPTGS